LVVAPSDILTSQPGLKRLREGFADAQLNASQLSGRFTEQHPLLVAARTTQDSIRERLVSELEASLIGLNQEIKTSQHKLDRLHSLQADAESKLGGLAENRAEYANVISEVKTRSTILETAERELAEAEASGEASSSISLISRLDQPTVSDGPVGPGKITIAGICTIAGLLFGLGIVFLISPNESGRSFGRRISDLGRRKEDQTVGTAAKPTAAVASVPIPQEAFAVIKQPFNVAALQTAASQTAEEAQLNRLQQNLANDHFEKRRERPAPILYDESNIGELKKPADSPAATMANSASTEQEIFEAYEMSDAAAIEIPAADEHPQDSSFREFLLSEIGKSDERRQHPRPAPAKAATASLSMRPSSPKF